MCMGFSHTVALVEWRRAPGRERERERDDGMNVSSSSFSESPVKAPFWGGADRGGGTNDGRGAEKVRGERGGEEDEGGQREGAVEMGRRYQNGRVGLVVFIRINRT